MVEIRLQLSFLGQNMFFFSVSTGNFTTNARINLLLYGVKTLAVPSPISNLQLSFSTQLPKCRNHPYLSVKKIGKFRSQILSMVWLSMTAGIKVQASGTNYLTEKGEKSWIIFGSSFCSMRILPEH